VSKATKRHCTGTVQSQGGRVGNVKNRWVLSRDQKTAMEGAEVQDQADCSRRKQRQPEKLGHRW